MFDRFTDEATAAIALARETAIASRAGAIDDLHILIACCRVKGSRAARVLLACGQDPVEVCARAEAGAARLASIDQAEVQPRSDQLPFSENTGLIVRTSLAEATRLGQQYIGTEHLLLAMLRTLGNAHDVLSRGGLKLLDASKAAAQVRPDEARVAAQPVTKLDVDAAIVWLRNSHETCIGLKRLELAQSLQDLIDELENMR